MGHGQWWPPVGFGRPRRAAALAAVLLQLALPAQAATLLESLDGRWTTPAEPSLSMDWSQQGSGFGLRWSVPGDGEAQATFQPSDRPGVFFAERDEGWSMFGGEAPPNPLLDGPLLWARASPDVIHVYRVVIDAAGGFMIDRYACRLQGEGLEVDFQRRLPGGRTEESRMRLTRAPS